MKLQTRALWVVAISTVVGVLAAAVPVQALEPSHATTTVTNNLEEIVVTARKQSEDVQKVPVSIITYSGEELKQQSVRNLNDVQGAIPGLLLQQGFDDPQSLSFMLRGRKQNDVTLGADQAVGLYVDGVYVPRTMGMKGALADIGRIEVLRGPQGTLYGRNTTGGAIGLYTNEPTDRYGATLDVSTGNYGAWSVLGIANVPLNDKLAARFVFEDDRHDGYGHNAIGEQLGNETGKYYRGKLRWTPTEDVTTDLTAHYQENHSSGSIIKLLGLSAAAGGSPQGSAATLETEAETGLSEAQSIDFLNSLIANQRSAFYDNGGTAYTYSNVSRWDSALDINVNLGGDLRLRSITGAQGLHRDAFLGSPTSLTLFALQLRSNDKYYSQEFELLKSTPTVNWIGGLYAGYEDGQDDSSLVAVPALAGPVPTATNAGLLNTSLAGFGQGTWEFIPRWRLTEGARYSWDKRRADMVVFDTACEVPAPGVETTIPGPGHGPAQCPRTFQNTFTKTTWLASLDYSPIDNVLVYAKVATGFRSGGQNIGGYGDIKSFAPYAPEENIEYETGVKSQFLSDRLRVNLASYYDSYSNLQETIAFLNATDQTIVTAVTNAATAYIKGLEAEVDARITSRLTVHLSGAYTDAYYGRFTDFTGDRSGEPFGVPRWIGALSGRYVQPTSIGALGMQVDYDWRSTYVVDGRGVSRALATQSAFGLLNVRIDLKIDQWGLDVALFGRNLTVENYLDQVTAHDQPGGLGTVFGYPGQPRTYGLEIIKTFGEGTTH